MRYPFAGPGAARLAVELLKDPARPTPLALFEGVADEDVLGMFAGVSGVPARFAGHSKDAWQAALQATARVGLLTPLQEGDLGQAKAAFRRALAIDEKAYGRDHPDVAGDVNNLGAVLQEEGDLAQAKAAYQRALAIDEKAYGPDHPNTRIARDNLDFAMR